MADQVSLTIEEDTGAPPGHARLCFAGLAPPADAHFRLRRLDAEPEHLGPHGWQNSPALLEPDAVVDEGGTTVLQVGPAVVDRVAADAPIEVDLPAADLSLRSYWPDIAPSPGAADLSVAVASRAPVEAAAAVQTAPVAQTPTEPPPPPKPPPPPPPAPEPEPEPIPPPEPEPEPIHVEPPAPEPAPPPEPGGRRWLPLALGGLLVLLLIVGGVWQLGLLPWPADEEQSAIREETAVDEEEQQEAPQQETTRQEEAPEEETTEPETSEQEPLPPSRDWRAELLEAANNNASAEQLFEIGQGAAEAGELEIALLAYEEAIRQGSGPALLEIGRWYDPAYYSADSAPFSQPNPEQAAIYYKRAREAGVEEASDALDQLCGANLGAAWFEQSCPPVPGN